VLTSPLHRRRSTSKPQRAAISAPLSWAARSIGAPLRLCVLVLADEERTAQLVTSMMRIAAKGGFKANIHQVGRGCRRWNEPSSLVAVCVQGGSAKEVKLMSRLQSMVVKTAKLCRLDIAGTVPVPERQRLRALRRVIFSVVARRRRCANGHKQVQDLRSKLFARIRRSPATEDRSFFFAVTVAARSLRRPGAVHGAQRGRGGGRLRHREDDGPAANAA
jgi:hypothetical protein